MYQFTDFHLAISNKLGWDDMLAEIALPAIDRIISRFLGNIAEATGDVLPFTAAGAMITSKGWTPDEIFSLLCPGPGMLTPSESLATFKSLRGEMEEYMRKGFSYEDAIHEWYK